MWRRGVSILLVEITTFKRGGVVVFLSVNVALNFDCQRSNYLLADFLVVIVSTILDGVSLFLSVDELIKTNYKRTTIHWFYVRVNEND